MNKKPLDIFDFLRGKFPKEDFFSLYKKRDRIAEKLPYIAKIRNTDWTIADNRKVNHQILKDKLNDLFEVLEQKKFPNIEKLKKAKEIINSVDMRYYSMKQDFNFCYSDNFHTLFFFYYNDKYISDIKKYKRWTFDREYNVSDLLSSIINKYESRKREQEIYSRIKKFRAAKKQRFIVEIDFIGFYFYSDWTTNHQEKLHLLISDINEEAVLKRIYKGIKNDANDIVKHLSSKECHQGNIISYKFLEINEENINKVLQCRQNRHLYRKNNYEKWNCFSLYVDEVRHIA